MVNWEKDMARGNNDSIRSQFDAAEMRGTPCDWNNCDKSFASIAGLKQHQRRIHRKDQLDQFKCRKCGEVLKDECVRTNHEKTCQGLPRGICPYCGENKSISNISKHKRLCALYYPLLPNALPRNQPINQPISPSTATTGTNQGHGGTTANTTSAVTIICSKCGAGILKSNLSRHLKRVKCQTSGY